MDKVASRSRLTYWLRLPALDKLFCFNKIVVFSFARSFMGNPGQAYFQGFPLYWHHSAYQPG